MNNFDNIYNDMKDLDNKSLKKYILNYDLEKNKTTLETLLFIAYDLHKFELSNDKLEEKIKRQHQNKYRNDLIKRYKSCIVTGKHASICEASHIIPFMECTNEQKYDINNGLLLCSELHKLFDINKVTFDTTGKFIISNEIMLSNGNDFNEYKKYNGIHIKLNDETKKYLNYRVDKFIF